jgi:hypothetical protein
MNDISFQFSAEVSVLRRETMIPIESRDIKIPKQIIIIIVIIIIIIISREDIRLIRSTYSHHVSLIYILILSSEKHLSLSSSLFKVFPTKIMYAFLISMFATYLVHLVVLVLMAVRISDLGCLLRASSLSAFLLFPPF